MRPITFTSALENLLIIPSKVDFPTPEPANIPTLCPSPQVKRPSIAFIPVVKMLSILFLFKGFGGVRWTE